MDPPDARLLAARDVGRLPRPAIASPLEAAADPDNGLAAIAVVGPRRTAHVGRLVEEAERSGAVGYRLDGWDGTTPPPESVHEILRAVAATGRPLLVPIVRFGAASVIGAATAGLGIPVVLLGAHYTHIVDDLAAAVRYPHLHLETSALAHFRAIETVVGSIGAERLLFGTGSPVRAAASPISAVLAASIPDDAKRAILGGNAVRLFGVADGPVDLTMAAGPDRAFDVHTHLGPLDFDVAAGGRRRPGRRVACPADGGGGRLGRDRDLRRPGAGQRPDGERRRGRPRWRPVRVRRRRPDRPATRPRTSCGATSTPRACSGSRSTASGAARRPQHLR